MALTRKFLAAMGIEEDKIDEIINAHTETVNGLKGEIDKYKPDAEKLEGVQKELDKVKKDLEDANEAMKNGDKSPYKVKYENAVEEKEKLQKEFDKYKAGVDAKEIANKKSDAYKKLLKKAGISEKRLDAILKVTALDDVELEEDGKIKDSDTLTETIKKEWSDFIVTKGEKGAEVSNPPENNGGSGSKGTSLAARRVAKFNADRYGTVNKED